MAGRQREVQVEWRRLGSQEIGQHSGRRLHLGVPIVSRLDDIAYTPNNTLLTNTLPLTYQRKIADMAR